MRNVVLMTVALALFCASPVFAGGGGGGGKRTSRIVVRNQTNAPAVVVLNVTAADRAAIEAAAAPADIAALVAASGGRFQVANAGGQVTFANLAAGTFQVGFFGTAVVPVVAATQETFFGVAVVTGQTKTITVAGDQAAAVGVIAFLDLPREVMFASLGLSGLALLALAGFMVNRKKA